jgi:hypothetical protein
VAGTHHHAPATQTVTQLNTEFLVRFDNQAADWLLDGKHDVQQ